MKILKFSEMYENKTKFDFPFYKPLLAQLKTLP